MTPRPRASCSDRWALGHDGYHLGVLRPSDWLKHRRRTPSHDPGDQEIAVREAPVPPRPPDDSLYSILGLDRSASDAEVQVAYRRRAARLATSRFSDEAELKDLNAAYEVLGVSARRAEYDRFLAEPPPPPMWPPDDLRVEGENALDQPYPRMRHAYRSSPEHERRGGDLLVMAAVVGLAALAGWYVLTRARIEIPLPTSLPGAALLGLSRPAPDSAGAAPAPAATTSASPIARDTSAGLPGSSEPLRAQMADTTVTVSNPSPPRGSLISVTVRLRRSGQPVPNAEVWLTAQYRTVQERWPGSGAVRTGPDGSATISFNVGDATPGYEVKLEATARIEAQELTFPASFTPR